MRDIGSREDIALLVDAFYRKVIPDPLIGPFFTQAVHFSWSAHIPVMVSFWETILLDAVSYKGNPMVKHIGLNQLMPMKEIHFKRWLQLWEETLRENFEGVKADEALKRASSIAGLMQNKIKQYGNHE